MRALRILTAAVVGAGTVACAMPAWAQADAAAVPPVSLRAYVPTTISPEAAAVYAAYAAFINAPEPAPPRTAADFEALYQASEKSAISRSEAIVKAMGATIIERKIGGVDALEIRPKGYKDDG
ncbi:MAG: hypothetical protein JWM77_2460, partial [Rhodospirillales bacterium]|nr:hypothetical protein [Rhodospirillales bacterium]